jgi:hypothetical protein
MLTFFTLFLFLPLFVILTFHYLYKLPNSPPFDFFESIILGHRGCGVEKIPENTIEAIKYAHDHKAQGKPHKIIYAKRN